MNENEVIIAFSLATVVGYILDRNLAESITPRVTNRSAFFTPIAVQTGPLSASERTEVDHLMVRRPGVPNPNCKVTVPRVLCSLG
jgi:hypothetical protein